MRFCCKNLRMRKQLSEVSKGAEFGFMGGRPRREEEKTLVQNPVQGFSGNDNTASTFHHSEPSPTTALENIATIKIVTNGQVTNENQTNGS